MNQVLQLNFNLFNNISLARKSIEIFLKKATQIFEIIVNDGVFGLANIRENQYVIWLAKNAKLAIVNQVIASTIKILYA